jgi:hypothetical protein
LKAFFPVPLAGTIEAVVEFVFYYTDVNSQGPEDFVDIHLLTGLANLTNRFTDAAGLELEMPEEKI